MSRKPLSMIVIDGNRPDASVRCAGASGRVTPTFAPTTQVRRGDAEPIPFVARRTRWPIAILRRGSSHEIHGNLGDRVFFDILRARRQRPSHGHLQQRIRVCQRESNEYRYGSRAPGELQRGQSLCLDFERRRGKRDPRRRLGRGDRDLWGEPFHRDRRRGQQLVRASRHRQFRIEQWGPRGKRLDGLHRRGHFGAFTEQQQPRLLGHGFDAADRRHRDRRRVSADGRRGDQAGWGIVDRAERRAHQERRPRLPRRPRRVEAGSSRSLQIQRIRREPRRWSRICRRHRAGAGEGRADYGELERKRSFTRATAKRRTSSTSTQAPLRTC